MPIQSQTSLSARDNSFQIKRVQCSNMYDFFDLTSEGKGSASITVMETVLVLGK